MADEENRAAELRRRAIRSLHALDRMGDPALAGLVRVAAHVTGAASAAVHVLDDEHQHRIAGHRAPLGRHPREDSMCRVVVDEERRVVTQDAAADPRFASTSWVRGAEPVRFYASVPLRAMDGTVVGTLCSFDPEPRALDPVQVELLEELAEHAARHLELMRLVGELGDAASRDPLTGAVNRLLLEDRLRLALLRRPRAGTEVLVALLDVDDFKGWNDRHGHEAGDAVLREVVRRLQGVARAEDTVARLGGDEFVFVGEVADAAGGETLAARLRAALAEDGGPAVSLGAAVAAPDDDPRAALERADRAMYAEKAARRSEARPRR